MNSVKYMVEKIIKSEQISYYSVFDIVMIVTLNIQDLLLLCKLHICCHLSGSKTTPDLYCPVLPCPACTNLPAWVWLPRQNIRNLQLHPLDLTPLLWTPYTALCDSVLSYCQEAGTPYCVDIIIIIHVVKSFHHRLRLHSTYRPHNWEPNWLRASLTNRYLIHNWWKF